MSNRSARVIARGKHRLVRSRLWVELPGKHRWTTADCGRTDWSVAGRFREEHVDYTAVEPTPDQLRIEDVLDRMDLTGARLLHVGVGNSQLAVRFAGRASTIDGLTVSTAEAAHAAAMGLANYRVHLIDKYDPEVDRLLPEPYDVVVDNNPASFACCRTHQAALMRRYATCICENGMLLTDTAGMAWTARDPRWAVGIRDLAALAAPVGLSPIRVDRHVVCLRRAQRTTAHRASSPR